MLDIVNIKNERKTVNIKNILSLKKSFETEMFSNAGT